MDLNLTGRTALVTGSSSGLGAAIAGMLAAEGASVIVHGRDEQRAQDVLEGIIGRGGRARVVIGDLSTDDGADRVSSEALSGGRVDILVNNAGTYDNVNWPEASPDDWASTYNTNVISGVRMIRRLVGPMREAGWGRIITIGGGLASQPMSGHPHYSATLAARHNLAVSLAREVAGSGITSNVVSPGAIMVDSVREVITQLAPERGWAGSAEEIERAAAAEWVPNDTGRFGEPDEIAGAVAYLCSDLAAYVSGATIRVDGGTIRSAF